MRTKMLKNGDLEIPVFDGDRYRWLKKPVTMRGTLLAAMFTEDELRSVAIVKINCRFKENQEMTADAQAKQKGDELNSFTFPDQTNRTFAFSSGDNFFLAAPEMVEKLQQFFKSNLESACTHGSLITSDCFQGMQSVNGLRVKVVDFSDPKQLDLGNNDCFGFCSPKVAQQLGNPGNRPFQFRLGYKAEWSQETGTQGRRRRQSAKSNAPQTSFVAKGVLLPQANLEALGCDIVLDRSSIKGLDKAQLNTLLPCGDYILPQAVLGNRQDADVLSFANNWEFLCWFSPDAIQKDLVRTTREAALELAALQKDPLTLHKWMIEQMKNEVRLDGQGQPLPSTENRWLELLEADTGKHLTHDRNFTIKAQEMLQNQWRDLATRGAYEFSSGMAVPINDLPQGCVCVPHLKNGADVIITRYPIVSKDNIRVAKNVHLDGWKQVHGIVGIRPEDAGKFQADYDGDQMVVCPAEHLPNIAQECRRIEQRNEFKPIQKYEKRSYFKALNDQGRPKYPTLSHVAIESARGQMAMVCFWIGNVQDSQPAPGEDLKAFATAKKALLEKLFQAMQIEVDHPKSAMTYRDVPGLEHLSDEFQAWNIEHPSPFFQVYKEVNLYKTFSIPTHTQGPLYVLAGAINPLWDDTRLKLPNLQATQYLAAPILERYSPAEQATAKEWANQTRQEFAEFIKDLRAQDLEPEQVNEAIGEYYLTLRSQSNQAITNPTERLLHAAALWHVCHDGESTRIARDCVEAAKDAYPYLSAENQPYPGGEYDGKTRYVINVPMCRPAQDGNDPITALKDELMEQGIPFKAIVRTQNPVVQFMLDVPCPFEVAPGEEGIYPTKETIGRELNPAVHALVSRYTPDELPGFRQPEQLGLYPEFSWVINPQEVQQSRGAVSYNVLGDAVAQMLSTYQAERTDLVGLAYNDYGTSDMDCFKGKTVQFVVGQKSLPREHPQYERYHGTSLVYTAGKSRTCSLGVFTDESAKLPIGSRFAATIEGYTTSSKSAVGLAILPHTIEIPEVLTPKAKRQQAIEAQREASRSRKKPTRSRDQER